MNTDAILSAFGGTWLYVILSMIFFGYFVYSLIRDYRYKKMLFDRKAGLEEELKQLDKKYEAQLKDLEEHKKKLDELIKKGK